jgi:uncharacterized membrane protein YhaH (DUF805 family)
LRLPRPSNAPQFENIGLAFLIFGFWALLAALAKRFHDIGQPGYMCFLVLIPIVGVFTPFVLLFLRGAERSNTYGPPVRYF